MRTNKRQERELGKGIESLIGEANTKYGALDDELDEEEKTERERGDVALRDEAISLIEELIRRRKQAEWFRYVQHVDVTYKTCTTTSSDRIESTSYISDLVRLA
jgi:crotonobetainyl-CoA:carnitine CoA-transferase CaiB-like acyl-CoA transferase